MDGVVVIWMYQVTRELFPMFRSFRHPIRRSNQPGFIIPAVLCVLLSLLAIMMFTGYWPTHHNAYNSFVRQACSWLDGRLDIPGGEKLTWLELAIVDGKYYVTFPPFPSYVLLPFAAIWGLDTPDAWLALMITAIGVVYACLIYRRCCRDQHGLFWVLFLFLGTGYLFIGMNAWVWFFAQNLCFTLSLMAIYHAMRGQGTASLACWAAAVGCRPMVGLYLPFLLWLLYRHQRRAYPNDAPWRIILRRWYWIILPALLGGSYMLLNYLRFGSLMEFGHNFLPEFLRAENGQFSLTYIWNNILALLRLPEWNGAEKPLTFFKINGMAFYLTNPLLITILMAWLYALRHHRRHSKPLLILLPLLSLIYVLIICAHRTLGGWHFGNRYLLDVMPWLFFGLIHWKPRSQQFVTWNVPFAVFATAMNLIGSVVTYNKWI